MQREFLPAGTRFFDDRRNPPRKISQNGVSAASVSRTPDLRVFGLSALAHGVLLEHDMTDTGKLALEEVLVTMTAAESSVSKIVGGADWTSFTNQHSRRTMYVDP